DYNERSTMDYFPQNTLNLTRSLYATRQRISFKQFTTPQKAIWFEDRSRLTPACSGRTLCRATSTALYYHFAFVLLGSNSRALYPGGGVVRLYEAADEDSITST
ncbi:hypothetical protein JI435_424500, partial [Parastagonospora nodorum SN15]